MQEIRSSNPPVVAGICDPNKYRARHHRSLRLGSKLKYLNLLKTLLTNVYFEIFAKLTVTDTGFSFGEEICN